MSEKMTSGAPQSSRSGSYSSNPASVPRYMHYITIGGMPSIVHSGHGRKGRPTQHENSSNNYSSSRAAHKRAVSRILRRRQEIRRPLIGSEQRRRDKLRVSYYRLKNAVPTQNRGRVSHPRPSKMAVLDRAATHINSLAKGQQQLLAKIREVEEEAARLRQANEALALTVVVGQHLTVAPTPP